MQRVLCLAAYPLLALCAWGVLAFGAVYPWAYWPLACGSAGLSAILLINRRARSVVLRQPLLLPLGCLFAAIALQLVSLAPHVLRAVSPSAPALLAQYSLLYAYGDGAHALSIRPEATKLALVMGLAWASLVLVAASWLSVVGARQLVVGLAVLGFVVALVGIVQRPFFSGRIYGFWEPVQRGISFGPFVNRNHFAGWMAMCLPLTLGLVCARFASAGSRGARAWRNHLAWFSEPEASRFVLLMMGAVTMSLALVLSGSRSGALCLLSAVIATVLLVLRRQQGTRRKLAVAYVVGMAMTTVLWIGPTAMAQAYDRHWEEWSDVGGRLASWQDAASVISAFPVAGSGVNTYGAAMLFYQQNDRAFHYSAAHNDYLQIAAEGGLLVGIPAAWALAVLVSTMRRRFREDREAGGACVETYWIRVGAATGLIAIGLQEVVDFSLQIPGNAVLFACLCAIATHRAPEVGPARS